MDVNLDARRRLRRFKHAKTEVVDEPYLMLLRLRHRIPIARPRRFLVSREMGKRTQMLTDVERAGLAALKEDVEQGRSLLPRMSEQVMRHFNDDLFNDWGIHHFHLGTELRRKGFYTRSRHVAMAIVQEDRFLLIDVVPHGNDVPEPWADNALLSIVQRQWPDVLAPYRMRGVAKLLPDWNPQDRRELRSIGVFLGVEVDGISYLPPGGGITTDRGSADVSSTFNDHRRKLRDVQLAWHLTHPGIRAIARLLPRQGIVIETADGSLWQPFESGANFVRLEGPRLTAYRYMLLNDSKA